MPRMVICRDINEKRPMPDCYKASDGKWYSSEAAWKIIEKEKQYRNKCYDIYRQWLQIPDNLQVPTYWKKIVKGYESYGYDCLYMALLDIDNNVLYALSHKTFNSDINCIKYINAIISNNINKTWKKLKQRDKQKIQAEQKEFKPVYEKKKCVNQKQKVKDISKFLDVANDELKKYET